MVTAAAQDSSQHDLAPVQRVAQACAELLPVDGAAISAMAGTAHRETLYSSDKVIAQIEAVQFSLGEGPCFEAFETGRPVLAADLSATGAGWPVFAAQIAAEPVGAIFAFPLAVGAARVGAIDMYRTSPGTLGVDELATALQVADLATTALLSANTDGELPEQWMFDVPSMHAAVHQATGMLISAHGVDPGQALALLRGHAFTTGRLVDDVAGDLVNRRLAPEDIGT